MIPAIEAKGLSFAFEPGRDVLRNVSFSIAPGERVSILGGNGAGKSTLVWCMAGILRPRGELRIGGERASSARGRVGLVFQNPEDQLFMPTIEQDLVLPLVNRGVEQREATATARYALAQVRLGEAAHRPASRLSFGQRKRAAIAAALITEPDILILDEPTAELDRRAVRELQEALSKLTTTLVIVTHDLDFAAATTNRTLLLASGQIASDSATECVLNDSALLSESGLV